MRIAVIGRSANLLEAARLIFAAGHEIPLLWVARSASHYTVTEQDYKAFAESIGATFIYGQKINTGEAHALLRSMNCRLAVSSNYPVRLTEETIGIFPDGVLNAHPGALPRYKGNATNNWAILNCEEQVGITVHYMDAGLDTGDILLQEFLQLGPDTYIGEVHEWFTRRSASMLAQAVAGLGAGSLVRRPQDKSIAGSRTYFRRQDDGRIIWQDSAERIHRLIRAVSRPYGGAHTTLEGDMPITVWRACLHEHHEKLYYQPGQICMDVEGDPVVGCGEGLLRLQEVEADGHSSGETKRLILAKPSLRLFSFLELFLMPLDIYIYIYIYIYIS